MTIECEASNAGIDREACSGLDDVDRRSTRLLRSLTANRQDQVLPGVRIDVDLEVEEGPFDTAIRPSIENRALARLGPPRQAQHGHVAELGKKAPREMEDLC